MKLPANLSIFEGDLYNDVTNKRLREKYQYQFSRMDNLNQVKATLRAGDVTWPGGYPLYLITRDGAALCFKCAHKEFRQIVWDYLNDCSTGWRVIGCEANWEDTSLHCEHCGEQIHSAYGDDEEK